MKEKIIMMMVAMALSGGIAMGSVITGSSVEVSGAQDLTASGNVDWAYWDNSANPIGTEATAANSMSGGSGIGTITGFDSNDATTTVRGVNNGDASFSFTDGTTTTSATGLYTYGVCTETLNALNYGVSLDFTLAEAGTEYTINVWTFGAAANSATITATLNGYDDYTATELSYADTQGTKDATLFTFTVTAAEDNDVFNFGIELASDNTDADYDLVAISAASLSTSVIPEPATIGMLGLGSLGLLIIRRRFY